MEHFTQRDFLQYYQEAYIKCPDGVVGQVVGPADNDHSVVVARLGRKGQKTYALKEIDWPNVGEPRLGYRNIIAGGKGLYYIVRKIGRITAKGFSHRTIAVQNVPGLINTLTALGLNVDAYMQGQTVDNAVAQAVYEPTFVSLGEAIDTISNKADAVGFAIDYDFAVIQGCYKHNTFTLMWKQLPVASSENGRAWRAYSPEYKDIINRNIGQLRYVDG